MKSIYEVYNPTLNYWYRADDKKSYLVFKSLGYKGRIKRVDVTNSTDLASPAEVKHPA